MSNKIAKSPEMLEKEAKIADLQARLKKKKTSLKSLKTRLSNTKKEIEDIQYSLQSKMMNHMEAMDSLRQEIAALAKKLSKIKGIPKEERMQLKEMAEDLMQEDLMDENYQQYKERKTKMEEGNFDFDAEERARMRDMFSEFAVAPKAEEKKDIRKIFLNLSKKFHPDKAKNEQELKEFHQMMQTINDAYQQNDIQLLLEMERLYLMEDVDFTGKAITIDVLQQTIDRLQRNLDFIENQISRTSAELKSLRKSELGQMLTSINRAEKQGEGISAMEAELKHSIHMLTQMRDGMKDSLELGEISPSLLQLIDPMKSDNMPADFMEMMMAKMAEETGEDPEDLMSSFFNEIFSGEQEKLKNLKFPIGTTVEVNKKSVAKYYENAATQKWVGEIFDAYYDNEFVIYSVNLDKTSLLAMPIEFIRNSVDDIGDFSIYEFPEQHLKKVKQRDSEKETLATYRTLYHNNAWNEIPSKFRQPLINILLNEPSLHDEQNWVNYLEKNLTFPFKAKTKGLLNNQRLTVEVFSDEIKIDENHGILVIASRNDYPIPYPLMDLEGKGKNEEVLKIFHLWAMETYDIF